MTELQFAERLKRFRKAKNMTQQELADRLGVSNKSVSRWESGGGYPDVDVLVPLARNLGVTVDDLLCDVPPIRTLNIADWQNLLSFAFAIGGGVGYFLLDLFMPALVCYLLYLEAMAYGVYLQMRYTYHSRWFYLANGVMNFFVNARLLSAVVLAVLAAVTSLPWPADGETGAAQVLFLSAYQNLGLLLPVSIVLWLALTVLLAAVTQHIICRRTGKAGIRIQLERAPMTWRKAAPVLLSCLLLLFWGLYNVDLGGERYIAAPLPEWMYRSQMSLYLALAALCVLVCIALFWKRGRRGMLAPSVALVLGSAAWLPALADGQFIYSQQGNVLISATTVESYTRFLTLRWQMVPAAAVLILIYVFLCRIRINLSNITLL